MKGFLSFFLILGLFLSCAPKKDDVTDVDVKRLIERISLARFSENLEYDAEHPSRSEYKIFLEACEIYRLKPDLALEKIRSQNPELYKYLVSKK